jgi:hypothetical protein
VRCEEYKILPCSGVHAGWFQWVLREAVARAGHYTSARDAARYYSSLALEIDSACADGRLDCLPPRATLAPPFRWEYLGDALREIPAVFKTLLQMRGAGAGDYASDGSPADLDEMAAMAGPIAPPAQPRFVVRGWLTSSILGPAPSLQVRPRGSFQANSSVTARPFDGPAKQGKEIQEFVATTDCPPERCDLALIGAGSPDAAFPLSGLVHGSTFVGTTELSIDSAREELAAPMNAGRSSPQLRLARPVARFCGIALRALWPVAGISLLLAIAFRRRAGAPALLYALALGSAVAVACRVLLLSYLEVTSIPSNNILYLSSATPFLIIFVVLGLYLGPVAAAGLLRASGPIGHRAGATFEPARTSD